MTIVPDPLGRPPGRAPRSALNTAAIVLVVLIAVAGLAVLAYIVLVVVALSSYGSNK